MTAPHAWSSGSEGGRLQDACGMLFKTSGQCQPGMAQMPVSCRNDCFPHPRGQEIDFGTKDSGVHFTHHNHCVLPKRGALTFPRLYAEISDCSSGARRCGVESNHSGKSSPTPEHPNARGRAADPQSPTHS